MRTSLFSVPIILIAMAVPCLAQVIIEETITTDSIDVFAVPQETAAKSPGLAMAQTILFPGLGHQYLGRTDRAIGYFTAEVLFIAGAIITERYSQRLFGGARSYAWEYSGTRATNRPDDPYWRDLGDYDSWIFFQSVQENNRTPENKILDEDLEWQWLDGESRDEYRHLRADATRWQVISSFCIGAMVLNRIVSFIDVRASTRQRSIRKQPSVSFSPYLPAGTSGAGVLVSRSF